MSLLADLRLSFRTLVQNPGFTAVAVTMLAVGIGVNATVFTVTNAVLFKGFPLVERNDRLLYITPKGSNCCPSYPAYLDYRAQAKSFSGMAIVHGVSFSLSDSTGLAARIVGNENSAETFRVVGQKPILGRDFTPADEIPGAPHVAILNYGFWERRYGRDPNVIGRTVRMNGAPFTFIGVMPQGFSFPQTVDVWVPLVQTPQVLKRENRETWTAFGRLRDGVTIESARAEMDVIGKRLALAYPATDAEFPPLVQNFHEFFIGPNAILIYGSMWGAVGFVLLIACANLANLLLARAIGRSREISVRIALGAGRWRIIRQLLIESLMLSGLGGFLGWWIAKWSLAGYERAMAYKSSWLILDYGMDHRVLGYLIAISIGTGILFGLAPALRLSRLDVNASLKEGSRGSTGGGRTRHLSAVLVIAEMALAVVLLAGAGVMIRSFLKIHNAEMGVRTANVLITALDLPAARYPSSTERISFYDRLQTRLESLPGVESIAWADALPSNGPGRRPFELAGSLQKSEQRPVMSALTISPSYFRTLGASLLAGREFNDADGVSGSPVVLVNQRFVSQYLNGGDPLGKRVRFFRGTTPGDWLTIVGVVSNIVQNDTNRQRFDPVAYIPFRQNPNGDPWIFARTSASSGSLSAALRQEIQALDTGIPIYGPYTLADRLESYWDSRFYGGLFLIFAAIALLLASIGLYTVIAYSVSQRRQEIGIRIAIGGTPRDIVRLVFRQGMIPLGIGLLIGLAGSLAVNRILKSMLVQVSPYDPITLAAASGVLVVAAMLGCLIPARRAMRVDPVVALRNE